MEYEQDEEEFPVLKYTVQLYYSPESEHTSIDINDIPPPQQIASGVLVRNGSKFFLLTCKHVFDKIKVDDVVILTSFLFAVRLPSQATFINNDNDSIDLAVIPIKGARISVLKSRFSFLPSKYLGFDHIFDEDLFYMLFGYINKRTKRDGREFHSEPFGFLTGIKNFKKIEKLGFDYENNITLEYNRRKQSYLYDDTEIRNFGLKDLKGLSGGGIWLSVDGSTPDTYDYLLLGIMIEERIERGFVIGTKIDLIKKAMNSL
jgi:hypothetical protein